jgi:hypothetical protein
VVLHDQGPGLGAAVRRVVVDAGEDREPYLQLDQQQLVELDLHLHAARLGVVGGVVALSH